MDDQVRAIRERLRASMAQPAVMSQRASGLPIISFEDVAGLPDGAETLVHRVVAALKARGYQVACLRRFGVNTVPESVGEPGRPYIEAHADAVVFAAPGRMVKVEPVERESTFDQMLDALGDCSAYDVVICESFGYLPLPKILVTRKAQEGFNLGLPNVVGYVSNQPDNAMMIPYFAPDDENSIAAFIERHIMEAGGRSGGAEDNRRCEGAERL